MIICYSRACFRQNLIICTGQDSPRRQLVLSSSKLDRDLQSSEKTTIRPESSSRATSRSEGSVLRHASVKNSPPSCRPNQNHLFRITSKRRIPDSTFSVSDICLRNAASSLDLYFRRCARFFCNSFTINTYATGPTKPFRIRTYKKGGGGIKHGSTHDPVVESQKALCRERHGNQEVRGIQEVIMPLFRHNKVRRAWSHYISNATDRFHYAFATRRVLSPAHRKAIRAHERAASQVTYNEHLRKKGGGGTPRFYVSEPQEGRTGTMIRDYKLHQRTTAGVYSGTFDSCTVHPRAITRAITAGGWS
jgi:hypothetical protein